MRKPINFLLKLSLIILPPLLLVIIFSYAHSQTLHILPSREFYSRGYRSLSSQQTAIEIFEASPDSITMQYLLSGNDPYAGIRFHLAEEFPLLNLTGYAAVSLEITTAKKISLSIIVKTFEPGITERTADGFSAFRVKETTVELDLPHTEVNLPLGDFTEPGWWLDLYAGRQGLERNPFRYAYTLELRFHAPAPPGQHNRVMLEKVTFQRFSSAFWWLLFGLSCGYYVLYGAVLFCLRTTRKKQKTRAKLLSAYKKIAKESYREKDAERMNRYINNNYHDPAISLDAIVVATGLSRKRITALCQQEYSMTLKECINWLRLAEAKRLLLESDLAITEIAFALGYSSSSYFGVLFKNQEGVSPKEYRKKNQRRSGL